MVCRLPRLVLVASFCLCLAGGLAGHARARAVGPSDRDPAIEPAALVSGQVEFVFAPLPSGTPGELAGRGLAVEGDTLLVGAPQGMTGTPGHVFVFERSTPTESWRDAMVTEIMFPEPSGGTSAAFGAAIALDGDVAVVGAPGHGAGLGRVYVLERSAPGTWTRTQIFMAPSGARRFGESVAIDGDLVVIGAPGTDAMGDVPRAYVVDLRAPSVIMPLPTDTVVANGSRFGASVAVSGSDVLVGAPLDDFAGTNTGTAFHFTGTYDGGAMSWTWALTTTWRPSNVADSNVGESVAIAPDGSVFAVGAPGFGDVAAQRQGAVFTYPRAGGTFGAVARLDAEDRAVGDELGVSVALDDAAGPLRLVAGATGRPVGATTEGGAYLFERRMDAFVATARFFVSDPPTPLSLLGTQVAISGDSVLASTPRSGAANNTGIVAVFAVPRAPGEACTVDDGCESGICAGTFCCAVACGPCETCAVDGLTCEASAPGDACMLGGCNGTCSGGTCMIESACDTGSLEPDAPDPTFDAGPRPRVRVSGCKCGVAERSGPGALALVVSALVLGTLARRRRRSGVGPAILLAVALVASPAEAQEASGEYETTIGQALAEYDARNYEEAYALFTRAHELRPSARTERALGKAAFELRRYIECVRWLESSLTDERSPLTPEMREEVEALLGRARAFIGTWTVRSDTPGAELLVDTALLDGDLTSGIEVQLDLGEHEITVRATGYTPDTRRVVVRGTERETLEIALEEDTPDTIIVGGGDHTLRDLGYASLVAGGALVVVGIVATAVWADSVNTLNSNIDGGACFVDPATENVIGSSPGTPPSPICLDLESRYRLALPFTWIGFVGGAAFLGTGLGLVLGAPTSAPAEEGSVEVRCGPFSELGVACTGRF